MVYVVIEIFELRIFLQSFWLLVSDSSYDRLIRVSFVWFVIQVGVIMTIISVDVVAYTQTLFLVQIYIQG